MSRSEETDEAAPSPCLSLSDEQDQADEVRTVQKSGDSSSPSIVSVKSTRSMEQPLVFKEEHLTRTVQKSGDSSSPSIVSVKSTRSMEQPLVFKPENVTRTVQKSGDSSSPSIVSVKSDKSMEQPLVFKPENVTRTVQKSGDSSSPSIVSVKSTRSMEQPLVFKPENVTRTVQKSGDSSSPSIVSVKSDKSMEQPLVFKPENVTRTVQKSGDSSSPSIVSAKSTRSMEQPLVFKQENVTRTVQKTDDSSSPSIVSVNSPESTVFTRLDETISKFARRELRKMQEQVFDCEDDEDDSFEGLEDNQVEKTRKAFVDITVEFLKGMGQFELVDTLQKKHLLSISHGRLRANLKKKSQRVFEGIAKAGQSTLLSQIYTELYITEGDPAVVNTEHEIREIEKASRYTPKTAIRYEDIFKSSSRSDKSVRTILTKGVAGIGKTVCTQKFTLDWAEGRSNQDIYFVFPFSFRELNLLNKKSFSLVQLIHYFFPETKDVGINNLEEFRVLIILDSLDECRLPLDLYKCDIISDVSQSTSVGVLLANLIRKKLLPSAQLWITTRPAAASQIPPECVDMITEVRGFTDEQKDDYFKKRFPDKELAERVIAHIKSTQTLYIMCHIPVFCWITATIFENLLNSFQGEKELPKSLTVMYIDFLVTQTKQKIIKYDGGSETESPWNPQTKMMIQALAKLAFEQFLKGNIYFYESDLIESGIDVKTATVYSGVLTEIFQEDRGLFQNKVFCFIHLTVQEFLAALHVQMTFTDSGNNLLLENKSVLRWIFEWLIPMDPVLFYQTAIDKALESPIGHLDLFIRFLLGLSLPDNQARMQGLVKKTENNPLVIQKTSQYIKDKIRENSFPEKKGNLFHCLKELNDCSLHDGIQQYMNSESFAAERFSSSDWSMLAYVLMSEGPMGTFELRKYCGSDNALQELLPVIQSSTKAVLSCCNLTERSCTALASILTSPSCRVKELDLSNNDLQDNAVKQLCKSLQSPGCPLEQLSLCGCQITKKGCAALVSALSSSSCNLKNLDLRYNNLGESGLKNLSALQENSNLGKEIWVNPGGPRFMTRGLKKYACKVNFDPITANKKLILSNENRKVNVIKEKQPYDDHPERFDYWKQVLCTEGLHGRCFYEVEWEGEVYIGVAYEEMKRKGSGNDSCLGMNDKSWSLHCSEVGDTTLFINGESVVCRKPHKRVGIYLDWDAGTLSFFNISDQMTHIYTCHTEFTGPVYPAFRIRIEPHNSSVTLCE